jgi:hypothetical protein
MIFITLSLFASSFLLFLIQPLIGKYILPWYGSSPAVWSASLLFFQVLLTGGYAYTYALIGWLTPRCQAWVHGFFLGVSVLVLLLADSGYAPLNPPEWIANLQPQVALLSVAAAGRGGAASGGRV